VHMADQASLATKDTGFALNNETNPVSHHKGNIRVSHNLRRSYIWTNQVPLPILWKRFLLSDIPVEAKRVYLVVYQKREAQ